MTGRSSAAGIDRCGNRTIQIMGEIRIKVRLTNAVDEALARRGQIKPEQVRSLELDALVDTGSVRSVVPPQVAQDLGLQIRGQRVAEYADGRKEPVGVTEPLVIECLHRDTLEEELVPNPAHPNQPVTKVK